MNLMLLLALTGGILAAVQALLIVLQGDILCLNEGCEIVEKLTTVPPIVFNVVGSAYFLTVFLTLWQGRRGGGGWIGFARLLLLAGMAAEGGLVGFQYYVAEVFCSYCLIIFSIILLLNLLLGWRQTVTAMAVWGAVLLAFASLEFTSRTQSEAIVLEKGTYGRLVSMDNPIQGDLYLFFSSTCPHCEEIIETIDESFSCELNFNPIDELPADPVAGLVPMESYSPTINRRYLKNMGISEIPVLVSEEGGEIRVLRGKQLIQQYLDGFCRDTHSNQEMSSEISGMSSQESEFSFLPAQPRDEACSVEIDCEEVPAAEDQGQ